MAGSVQLLTSSYLQICCKQTCLAIRECVKPQYNYIIKGGILMETVNIGDTVKIISMKGEPHYTNRVGVVTHIDDAGKYTERGVDVLSSQRLIILE